jgi:hypothetical protein
VLSGMALGAFVVGIYILGGWDYYQELKKGE